MLKSTGDNWYHLERQSSHIDFN